MGINISRLWKRFMYSAATMLGLGLLPACKVAYGMPEPRDFPVMYGPPPIDYPDMYGMPPASCHHTISGTVIRGNELVAGVKVQFVINGLVIEEDETDEYGNYCFQYYEEAEDGLAIQLIFDGKITKDAVLKADEYEVIVNLDLTEEENVKNQE